MSRETRQPSRKREALKKIIPSSWDLSKDEDKKRFLGEMESDYSHIREKHPQNLVELALVVRGEENFSKLTQLIKSEGFIQSVGKNFFLIYVYPSVIKETDQYSFGSNKNGSDENDVTLSFLLNEDKRLFLSLHFHDERLMTKEFISALEKAIETGAIIAMRSSDFNTKQVEFELAIPDDQPRDVKTFMESLKNTISTPLKTVADSFGVIIGVEQIRRGVKKPWIFDPQRALSAKETIPEKSRESIEIKQPEPEPENQASPELSTDYRRALEIFLDRYETAQPRWCLCFLKKDESRLHIADIQKQDPFWAMKSIVVQTAINEDSTAQEVFKGLLGEDEFDRLFSSSFENPEILSGVVEYICKKINDITETILLDHS